MQWTPLPMKTSFSSSVVLFHDEVCSVVELCAETGGLFGLAVRMMQLFSENKRYAELTCYICLSLRFIGRFPG